jgi:hypothetical protein
LRKIEDATPQKKWSAIVDSDNDSTVIHERSDLHD